MQFGIVCIQSLEWLGEWAIHKQVFQIRIVDNISPKLAPQLNGGPSPLFYFFVNVNSDLSKTENKQRETEEGPQRSSKSDKRRKFAFSHVCRMDLVLLICSEANINSF